MMNFSPIGCWETRNGWFAPPESSMPTVSSRTALCGFSLRRLEGVQAQEQRLAYLKTHMPSLEYEGRANLFLYCQYAMQMSIQYLSGEELRQAKESLRKTVSGLTPLLPSRKLSPAGNVWLALGQLSFEGSCRLMNCLERRNGKGSE